MAKLDLPAAANLQLQQASSIAQLWAIFVTATFAAAVLNVSTNTVSIKVSIAVTVGYWLFALGHFCLLYLALRVARALASNIRDLLAAAPEDSAGFKASFEAIARTSYRPYASYVIHIAIDLCVTVSIWAKHLA